MFANLVRIRYGSHDYLKEIFKCLQTWFEFGTRWLRLREHFAKKTVCRGVKLAMGLWPNFDEIVRRATEGIEYEVPRGYLLKNPFKANRGGTQLVYNTCGRKHGKQ